MHENIPIIEPWLPEVMYIINLLFPCISIDNNDVVDCGEIWAELKAEMEQKD